MAGKKIEEASRCGLGGHCRCDRIWACSTIIARALRKALKDSERLDWLLESGRIVWPAGIPMVDSRRNLDAAISQGRRKGGK